MRRPYCLSWIVVWWLGLLAGCAEPPTVDPDVDGDGSPASLDCDDTDAAVFPGAEEVCGNEVDDDCDASTVDLFDSDGDGSACDVDCDDADPALNANDVDGDSVSTCAGDCDDDDALVFPGAGEQCANGIDDDCDASTVDVFDADNDGSACDVDCDDADPALNTNDVDGDSVSSCAGDCDDTDADVVPGATEQCGNGIDDDCDASTVDLFDGDADGSTCDVDCDDANPARFPGAREQCANGVDDDCDATTVDLFDADGDGAVCNVDCDDLDATLNLDDVDGDTVTTCAGDCDDADPATFPGAPEQCANGVDDDCDATTADIVDADGDGATCDVDCADDDPTLNLDDADGDTQSTCAGDCDDSLPMVNTLDRDGDGDTTCATDCDDLEPLLNGLDVDADGFASCAGDCDDVLPAVFPGASDDPCTGIDEACDGRAELLVGGAYATVQDAEDAALDGDIICLPAGTHVETGVEIDKVVEVRGLGESTSTLDARATGIGLTFLEDSAGSILVDLTTLGTPGTFAVRLEDDVTIGRVTLDGGGLFVESAVATVDDVSILNTTSASRPEFAIRVDPGARSSGGLLLTDVDITNAFGILNFDGLGPLDIDGLVASGTGPLGIDSGGLEPVSVRDATFTGIGQHGIVLYTEGPLGMGLSDVTFIGTQSPITVSGGINSGPTVFDRVNIIGTKSRVRTPIVSRWPSAWKLPVHLAGGTTV